MSQQVQGVVSRGRGKPVSLETVLVPDPGPGEAVVAVQACGVCHTDLHYREGAINDDFPFLLGHEAAGVVEPVGDGVTERRPGRLRHPELAGGVRAVPRLPARPALVLLRHPQRHPEDDPRGRHRAVARPSASAPSRARRWCTPGSAPRSTRAVAPRGRGAARLRRHGRARRRDQHRPGGPRTTRVAVIGCGGVGDAAIAGARLAGARTIIAVDVDDRKLEWARDFGATHTVNSRSTDPVEAIRELTGGFGADVVIDAVGRPETYRQAFYARDLAGTVVLVGVPNPTMTLELPLLDVFGRGGALKSSWYGDCLPSRDFPTADRPAPAGPAAAGRGSSPRRSASATWRRRSSGCTAARSCAPSWCSEPGPYVVSEMPLRVDRVVTSGVFSLDGQDFDVENNVWLVGDDTEVVVVDAAHDAEADRWPRSATAGCWRSLCTHGHNDHIDAAGDVADATGAAVLLHPEDRMLWDRVHPDRQPRPLTDGERIDGRRRRAGGAAHPGPLPRRGLPVRPGPGSAVQRGHPVPRRAGRHRTLVQQLPADPGVDPDPAARPARRDPGAHRARRGDHDRRPRPPTTTTGWRGATDAGTGADVRPGRHVPRRRAVRPGRHRRASQDADVVVLGAPYDAGASYRAGARFGPQAIRMTDYLPHDASRPHLALRVDPLRDLTVVDAGDVEMPGWTAGSRSTGWRRPSGRAPRPARPGRPRRRPHASPGPT